MHTGTNQSIGNEELATLKRLALEADENGLTDVTRIAFADRSGDSPRTSPRRLRRLEGEGLLDRNAKADVASLTQAGESALRREYEQYRRLFDANSANGANSASGVNAASEVDDAGEAGDATTVEYSGALCSGMGDGRRFVSMAGYAEQFRERLGCDPFPGILNVSLAAASVQRRSVLEAITPVPIDG